MSKMMSPCKDCSDRQLGCHGKCEKYAAFKDVRKEINYNKARDSKINSFKIDAEISTNKRFKRNSKDWTS